MVLTLLLAASTHLYSKPFDEGSVFKQALLTPELSSEALDAIVKAPAHSVSDTFVRQCAEARHGQSANTGLLSYMTYYTATSNLRPPDNAESIPLLYTQKLDHRSKLFKFDNSYNIYIVQHSWDC